MAESGRVVKIERGDWVKMLDDWGGYVGVVERLAKDGTWADVRWRGGSSGAEWTKRMPTTSLVPMHTIQAGAWTITDMARKLSLVKDNGDGTFTHTFTTDELSDL